MSYGCGERLLQFGITADQNVIGQIAGCPSIVIRKRTSVGYRALTKTVKFDEDLLMLSPLNHEQRYTMRDSLERQNAVEDHEATPPLGRKPVRSETRADVPFSRREQQPPLITMPPVQASDYERERRPIAYTGASIAMERHCSVAELSKQWGFSENTIRRLFRKEPGVIKIVHQGTLHKRGYTSMRIPERIAQRVHRRLQGIV